MGRQIERLGSMKAVFLAVMIVFCLMPASAAGKEAMDGTIVWPSGAGGWNKKGEAVRYAGRQIFDYMDGAGEVFLAYNFKTLTVQRFEREAHPGLVAELYEMCAPADAFGVFSFDRQDPEAGIGQGSEFGGGLLRFWKGRHFVSVYGEGEGKEQEQAVLEIGRKLASSIVETGEPPRIIRDLPEERRVEGSAGFVRSHVLLNQRCFISYENILGLGADTEAVFARYDFGKEKTFALIVAYPDEAKARNAFAEFKKAYALDAEGMGRPGGNRAWTGAEAQGTCIIIALNAPNSEVVRRLMEAAKLKLKEVR